MFLKTCLLSITLNYFAIQVLKLPPFKLYLPINYTFILFIHQAQQHSNARTHIFFLSSHIFLIRTINALRANSIKRPITKVFTVPVSIPPI